MKYTKSALGLLNAQYRSVLKKCLLINLGLFALAAPALADSQVVVGPGQTWAPGTDTTITGVSSDEGALTVKSGTIAANVNVTLSDNTSTSHGAALYYKDQNATSVQSEFSKDVTFSGNTSTANSSSGGAVFVSGGKVSFLGETNKFINNSITGTDADEKLYKRGGGAIDNQSYENESSSSPIDSVMVIGTADSTNTFTGNTSSMNGGAIMNRAVDTDGNATLTINGKSTFSGNSSNGKGGAIYNIQHDGHVATVNINGTALFENNTANGEANDIYNTGSLILNAAAESDSIVLNGGIDGDASKKGSTTIEGAGYVKVANALKNQNVTNSGELQLDGADLTGTTIGGTGTLKVIGDSEMEGNNTINQNVTVDDGQKLDITNATIDGTGNLTNASGGTLKITDSTIKVNVNNAGTLISDPTTYDGVTVANSGLASFDADTFKNAAILNNTGVTNLSNGVTFEDTSKITGTGTTNLVSGTTHFNNTENANTINLLSGANFDGTLNGGKLNTQNGTIDTISGAIQNATLALDVNTTTATADKFTSGITSSTIESLNVTGAYGTADDVTIALGTGVSLASGASINGGYYTKAEIDGSGNLKLSDKLVNTSTIRGTDATGETVTIADKAETTNIGTTNAKISLSDSGKTATVTAANGLVISNGTPAQDATLKATALGLNVNKGLVVSGTTYLGNTVIDTGKEFTLGGKAVSGIDGTTGTGNATLATVATLNAKKDLVNTGTAGNKAQVAVDGNAKTVAMTVTDTDGSTVLAGITIDGGATPTTTVTGAFTSTSGQNTLGDTNITGTFKLGGTAVTSSAAELNLLDGMTAVDTDGTTATANEATTLATVATVTDRINDAAGNGLTSSAGVINVGATDKSITVGADGIAVNVYANGGLETNSTNGLQIKAGNGVEVGASGLAVKAEDSTITVGTGGIKVGTITDSNITDGTISQAKINGLTAALSAKADASDITVTAAQAAVTGSHLTAGTGVANNLASLDGALITVEGKVDMAAAATSSANYAKNEAVNSAVAKIDGALKIAEGNISTAAAVNTTQSAALNTIAGTLTGGTYTDAAGYTAGTTGLVKTVNDALNNISVSTTSGVSTITDDAGTSTQVYTKAQADTVFQEQLTTANAGNGISITGDAPTIAVVAKANSGIDVSADGVAVKLQDNSGLKLGADGLAIKTGSTTQVVEGNLKVKYGSQFTEDGNGLKINTNAISANELQADAVTSSKILNGTILAEDLSDGAVTTAKIAGGAVTFDKLNAALVGSKTDIANGEAEKLTTAAAVKAYAAGVDENNTFTGFNTFKNDNGIRITNAAASGSADLKIDTTTFAEKKVLNIVAPTDGIYSAQNFNTTAGFNVIDPLDFTKQYIAADNTGLTIGDGTNDKFTVDSATGNTTVGGTLGVTGDFAVNTNKFTVAAATGNTTVGGTLDVTGASTFTGAVTANGNVTLGDAATDTITVNGTATFAEQIAATKGIAAGANGTALTDNSLVLQGTGSNKATLTGTANGLNVAEGLTVNGDKFTVAADSGNVATKGTVNINGATLTGSTSALTSDKQVVSSNGFKVNDNNSLTDGSFKLAGKEVNSIRQTALTKGTDGATTVLATTKMVTGTIKNQAEDATYTNSIATGSNITGTTLGTAIGNLDAAIGDRTYTNDYNIADGQTVAASLNAIDTNMGALATLTHNAFGVATPANVANITTAMNSLATNVATGMGGTFATDGSWKDKANNTVTVNYEYVDSANIMDAVDQVASNVGKKADIANKYNGVTDSQSVNKNLNAINGTIGDIKDLSAGTGSIGNAITNGTGVKPTTVVTALNNIDATLGKIHGLKATSDLGDKSNLASGTTVENHLVSLDNAIGDRSFTTTRYVAPNSDLATAVTALDSNLSRVEHKVNDLRHDFEAGMASMAAMSALVPNPRSSGDTSLSVGTGAYGGHTAVAFGGFHYLTDNILLNAGASWGNSDDMAYRLGVTWSW